MRKTVLVVDDDQEVLLTLKEGLERYHDSFAVSIAGDGLIAVEKLRKEPVSVVVADLKMPRMDGFQLLSHITENYPDIPVIAVTGYSTPAMKEMAEKSGAAGYVAKPFLVENLARLIARTLSRESEGGRLNSVSSGMFLQLMELEQKTCTIRMFDKESGKLGVLFFQNGALLDARCEDLKGIEAAYRIFSWEEVALSIQNVCPQKKCLINSDLQPIILEAMRLKDEARDTAALPDDLTVLEEIDLIEIVETPAVRRVEKMQRIGEILDSEFGKNAAVEKVYEDESYLLLLEQATRMGEFLAFGPFKAGYLEREGATDVALLAGDKPVVLDVAPRCPRDRLLRVLSRMKV